MQPQPATGTTERQIDLLPTQLTKEITLTRGKVAVVDAVDFEWLTQWKWSANQNSKKGKWYAGRTVIIGGKSIKLYMHRVICDAPIGIQVDHQDGDGLHNWRKNIRLAGAPQNGWNRGPNRNNKSGLKGVSWVKALNKWSAEIMVHGKTVKLGCFLDKEEAARVYAEAAKRMHGEFARSIPF
jgi:hypothetical protein